MYTIGLVFLVTVSRDIKFIIAMKLPDQKKNTIMNAIKQVVRIYRGKGHDVEEVEFNAQHNPVHTILADNEFLVLKEELEVEGITQVNVVAKDEHVPEVEHQNRVIKERIRAIVQTLPCAQTPKKMRMSLVQYVVYWVNQIPKEGQDF
jgi:hypothetical protein